MNELVHVDRFLAGWDSPPTDGDDPDDRLNEYIVGPDPISDDLYDEGGCD